MWRSTVDWKRLPVREQGSSAAYKPMSYSRQYGTEGTGLEKLFGMWSLGLVPWNRVETGWGTKERREGETQHLWAQPRCQGFACCQRSYSRPLLGWALVVSGFLDRPLSLPLLTP